MYQEFSKKHEIAPELVSMIPSQIMEATKSSAKFSKTVLIYFDNGMALAPILEMISQIMFNQSPVITLEPTEDNFNNDNVIVDTSYNISLCVDILISLFKDDHFPRKALWILVPCHWRDRIGTENAGRIDVKLAQLIASIHPEILYIQRP